MDLLAENWADLQLAESGLAESGLQVPEVGQELSDLVCLFVVWI